MSAADLYRRQAAGFRNELKGSSAALLGIAQGLLADGQLQDVEIRFLRDWLAEHSSVAMIWPGSSIYTMVTDILADGVITAEEREHLTTTLQKLIGGTLDDLAESRHVTALPLDGLLEVEVSNRIFCFTGDFAFGPRATCEQAVTRRGGLVVNSVSKKLHYLVVGGMGSAEWKHGSYGTKIEKAIQIKQAGAPLAIVHEDVWASSLRG